MFDHQASHIMHEVMAQEEPCIILRRNSLITLIEEALIMMAAMAKFVGVATSRKSSMIFCESDAFFTSFSVKQKFMLLARDERRSKLYPENMEFLCSSSVINIQGGICIVTACITGQLEKLHLGSSAD